MQATAPLVREAHELAAVLRLDHHRLLDQNVGACLERVPGERIVRVVGRGDDDAVEAKSKQFPMVGERGRHTAPARGLVSFTPVEVGDRDHLGLWMPDERRQVVDVAHQPAPMTPRRARALMIVRVTDPLLST